MGLMQFLCNGIEKASDALNGRFSSLDEVLARVVRSAEFQAEEYLAKTDLYHKSYRKHLEEFLVHQLVLLCEAKSILRLHSAFEILGTRESVFGRNCEVLTDEQKRASRVYSAMRHEFGKRENSTTNYPAFHYAFRDALQGSTSISGMDSEERKYIGFNIFEEYHNIMPMVSKLDHEGIKSFYSDYEIKIHNMAFQRFETEEKRLSDESFQRYRESSSRRVVRCERSEESKTSIHLGWSAMVYDTYRSYDETMCCIRVTDISKDFSKLL